MTKKIMVGLIVVLSLMSFCIFLAPENSGSGTVTVEAATQAELEAKQKNLEAQQADIKSRLATIRERAASAQEELDTINGLVENLQAQVDTLNASIEATEAEISELEAEIAVREEQIDENYDSFKERLRMMYMSGDLTGGLEVLLSTESYDDLLTRMYYIEKMAEHDQAIIDAITVDKATFEDKMVTVEAKRTALDEQRVTLNAKKTELDEEKAAAEALLAEIEEDQKALEEEQKKIDQQMTVAKAQLDALIAAESKKDVGSSYVGGSFRWPTPGYGTITSPYGRRWGTMHKGIDIGAPTGAKCVASNEGKVVTSAYNAGGYGNYVIINHGGGYMTVYAHFSKRLVSVGQYVAKGQTIGLIGSTGRSTGPHLHFEVRVNGTAVNPQKYV